MMYCGECGKKAKPGDVYCEKCGAKLEQEDDTKEENKQKEEKNNTIQKFKKENEESKQPMDPVKKKKLTVICVSIAIIFGLFYFLGTLVGPKKLAEKYFEATIKQDTEQLYDLFEIEKNELNNKNMFKKIIKNSNKNTKKIEVTNYKIGEPIYEDMNMKVTIPITYHVKGENDNKNLEVELYKSKEKKWLFYDKWVIESLGNDMVKEFKIECPKNSKIVLEGIKLDKYLDKKNSTKTKDVYILKNIFRGKYNTNINLPFGIDIKDMIYVNEYSNYSPYINTTTLTEKSKNKLLTQAKKDINNIYQNIINGKKFDDIKEKYEYKKSDLSDLEKTYENMSKILNGIQNLLELKIENIELERINYSLSENVIRLRVNSKYKFKVKYNYSFSKKEYESTTNNQSYLTYEIVDGEYKLKDISNLKIYF